MFFFFSGRRRHTRYWRDWSSDVCSSDLLGDGQDGVDGQTLAPERERLGDGGEDGDAELAGQLVRHVPPPAAGRESGGEGKRVDLGGWRTIKKKNKNVRCSSPTVSCYCAL